MFTRRVVLAMLSATFASPAFATAAVFSPDDVAINGYDTVAYFTQSQPIAGNLEYAVNWNDAVWLFATPDNMALFEADPESYAPQFGGYCAYALSKGSIAPTVPEAWTVHNGKLYLNFSQRARELWLADIPGNVDKANGYWPDILQ